MGIANSSFDWVDFYRELANILLKYKDNRRELVSKVPEIFEVAGINMPTIEKDNKLVDIDPFTIFGFFNKTSMRDENRKKIINAVAEMFSVSASAPTSFDGIPVLNPQNATFYYFLPGRGDSDIDDLWALFESALKYADSQTDENRAEVSKWFDVAINKKGNGNSKITMGLYWIAPDTFLNLDSRNEWFIYESGKIPENIVRTLPKVESKIAASVYFEISDKLSDYLKSGNGDFQDFKELSYAAWSYSEKVNEQQKLEKKHEQENSKPAGTAMADEDVETVHYWLYSPGDNAIMWDEFYNAGIMGIGWNQIGDLTQYSSQNEMLKKMKECIDSEKSFKSGSLATWQFANVMKVGDVVFAKRGRKQIIGRGIIESDYEFDPDRETFKNIRKVNWTDSGEWDYPGLAPMKTLTDITPYTETVATLNSLFEDEESEEQETPVISYPEYTKEDFLRDVYMDEESYDTLVGLLKNKKNVILQGAPGVGKTFAAKRLAYSMMGEKDQSRVAMVQFHQSYSYEDFIMGFRPTETGYELRKGVFYDFCKTAEEDIENDYFFIIDEINRGNLSKIFGELFMLIENDKRDTSMQLLYSNEKFSVPRNIYIIGMMNTADRSLAMLDYALRRRFAFYEMKPGFEADGFREYRMSLNSPKFNRLIDCVEKLNNAIADDDSLGEGFCIGHSYFCNLTDVTDEALSAIVEYEIIPLLKEYWFDAPDKVKDWSENLRSAIR